MKKKLASTLLVSSLLAAASGGAAYAEPPPRAALPSDVAPSRPSLVFVALDSNGHERSAVRVTIDGKPFASTLDGTPIPLDAGAHAFTFETEGLPLLEVALTILEGEKGRRERVVFSPARARGAEDLDPTRPAAGSEGLGARKVVGLSVAGLGVLTLGVAAAFGVDALSKYNAADSICGSAPGTCPTQAGVTRWSQAMTTGNVATYALVAGAVLVTSGAVIWLSPEAPAKGGPASMLVVGLGTVQFKAAF